MLLAVHPDPDLYSDPMSVPLMQKVYAMAYPRGIAKSILLNLAWHFNDISGECFPSTELMVSETGFPRSTVLKYRGWLEKHGYICIVRKRLRSGRGWKNHYVLTLEKGSATRTLSGSVLSTRKTERVRVADMKQSATRTPTKKKEKEPKQPHQRRSHPDSISADRSASRASLDSRSADLSSIAGNETDLPMPDVVAVSSASAVHRPIPDASRFDRPIISAEQQRRNEADACFQADLLQLGPQAYGEAVDWLNEDRHERALAAEAAQRGAGVDLVRMEMLKFKRRSGR